MAIPNVTTKGGDVIGNIRIVPIVWGTGFPYGTGSNMQSKLLEFLEFYIGPSSTILEVLAEYSTSGTSIGHGTVANGKFMQAPGEPPSHIEDSDLQNAIESWVFNQNGNTPGFPQPDSNTVYIVFLPHSTTVSQEGHTSCLNSELGFTGYHSWTDELTYIVIPCCAAPNTPLLEVLGSMTPPLGHEICETITDPQNSTWRDWDLSNPPEIADICNGQGFPQFNSSNGLVITPASDSFSVQPIWSRSHKNCVFGSALQLSGLICPNTVQGGSSVACRVELNIPVPTLPTGGVDVKVSTDSHLITLDKAVAGIAPAMRSALVKASAGNVQAETLVHISAALGSHTVTAAVIILPPRIASFGYSPASGAGTQTPPHAPIGEVKLTSPASANFFVALKSSEPVLARPSPGLVPIPEGSTSPTAPFYLLVNPVAVKVPVTITAEAAGSTADCTFTILPGGSPENLVKTLILPAQTAIGGSIVFCQYILLSQAGAAGGALYLSSSDPAVATVDAQVPVHPNAFGGTFSIQTHHLPPGVGHTMCTISVLQAQPVTEVQLKVTS